MGYQSLWSFLYVLYAKYAHITPATALTMQNINIMISIWHSSLFWNLSKGVCQDLLGLPNTGQPELPSIFIAKGEEMRGESALCLLYKKCRYMSILFTKKWPLHSGLFLFVEDSPKRLLSIWNNKPLWLHLPQSKLNALLKSSTDWITGWLNNFTYLEG